MSAQHTKWPWTVRTIENFGCNVVYNPNGDRFHAVCVAKVGDEKDARLIAAAPDLLVALEGVVAFMESTGFTTNFLNDARAAIAKARAAE